MQKESHFWSKWWNVVFLLTALVIVVADQLSKGWIRANLLVGESLPEVGFFQLTHVQNSGGVFGLFRGQSFPLTIVGLVAITILLVYAFFIHHRLPFLSDSVLSKLALGLVLGGTLGNLADRIRLGCITDFISIGIWPTFNIADSAIVAGMIIFAYSLLFLAEAEKS